MITEFATVDQSASLKDAAVGMIKSDHEFLIVTEDEQPTGLITPRRALVAAVKTGKPIEPGTNVVLYDREAERNWGYRDTDEPIEAWTTIFLWIENDEFQWTRGSRPIDADPQSLDGRYGFWMHRHGAEYFGDINFS